MYISKVIFAIGILLGLIAIIVHFALPLFIKSLIISRTRLEPNTELFKKWKKIEVPLSFSVYIFDIANVESVSTGKKPFLRERGPYVFRQKRYKYVIASNIKDTPIRYRDKIEYYYDPIRSNGSLNDKVTIVNLPIVAMAEMMDNFTRKLPNTLKLMANFVLQNVMSRIFELYRDKLFITVSIDEFLFKGYKVNIIDKINKLSKPLSVFNIKLPTAELIDGKFALFLNKNSTYSKLITIRKDAARLGEIIAIDGKRHLSHWSGSHCNEFKGSDGSLFPPFISKLKRLYIFLIDMCRPIYFVFKKTTEVKGITANRFQIPPSLFASPKYSPENECFCPLNKPLCHKNGVTYVGTCLYNAPLYLSLPHFLYASSQIVHGVHGTRQSPEKHISYLDLEPHLSIPLKAKIRLQINAEVRRFSDIDSMSKLYETLYPLAWFEQSVEITDELSEELQKKLIIPFKVLEWIKISFAVLSFMILVFSTCYYLFKRKERKSVDKNIHNINDIKDKLNKDTQTYITKLYLKFGNKIKLCGSSNSSLSKKNSRKIHAGFLKSDSSSVFFDRTHYLPESSEYLSKNKYHLTKKY